jgi:hypothetical protein
MRTTSLVILLIVATAGSAPQAHGVTAADVDFDDSPTHLIATDVQAAIEGHGSVSLPYQHLH